MILEIKKNIKKLLPKSLFEKIKYIYWNIFYFQTQRSKWFNRKSVDNTYSLVYWEDTNSSKRLILIDAVLNELKNISKQDNFNIFEYGSYSGINFRLIQDKLQNTAKCNFYAIEPNREAFDFMLSKLDIKHSICGSEKDFQLHYREFSDYNIDIAIVNAVFYSMSPKKVSLVLGTISKICKKIILCDCLENINGNQTQIKLYRTRDGEMTFTGLHPYKKLLKESGFLIQKVIDFPEEMKTNAGTGIIIASIE